MPSQLMNPKDRRANSETCRAPEADIDISLLEECLRLSPWQRLLENDRALALVRMLEAAQAQSHGSAQSDP